MLLGSLALAAILGVNGHMAVGSSKAASELTLGDVENVAEGWEWSDWFGWCSSGNWADAYDYKYCNMDVENGGSWYFDYQCGIAPIEGRIGFGGPATKITVHISKWYKYHGCVSGNGDCWSSDDTDCLSLYEKYGD